MRSREKTPEQQHTLSKKSMKDVVVRRTKILLKPRGKKPSGQEAHKGHKLSCSASPDEVIDDISHYPNRFSENLPYK